MKAGAVLGRVYRCPVCGAEVTVLAAHTGAFAPRCCNTDMLPLPRRAKFYFCPRCGAEIAVIRAGGGTFVPRCCNLNMVPKAA